jgi:methionyl-tRNA formyltransferase
MNKKRVIFMGTPIFAAAVLEHLITFPIEVVGVVTQSDKPVGRKQILTQPPVKVVALKHNLNVYQPYKVKEIEESLKELNIDYIITCAYGQFLPQSILNCAKEDALNIHASLLPKYRGGAPIHWSIIKGEHETGISLMRMIKAMDAGEVFVQKSVKITLEDTASSLHDKLIICAQELCNEQLMHVLNQQIVPWAQNNEEATFGYNIQPEDEHVSFSRSAEIVHNHIRGLVSWPVGHALLDSKRFKLYGSQLSEQRSTHDAGTIASIDTTGMHVSTLTNDIIVTHVQVEGRKMYPVKDDISYLSQFVLKQFK